VAVFSVRNWLSMGLMAAFVETTGNFRVPRERAFAGTGWALTQYVVESNNQPDAFPPNVEAYFTDRLS
jgi:hypothetical protein